MPDRSLILKKLRVLFVNKVHIKIKHPNQPVKIVMQVNRTRRAVYRYPVVKIVLLDNSVVLVRVVKNVVLGNIFLLLVQHLVRIVIQADHPVFLENWNVQSVLLENTAAWIIHPVMIALQVNQPTNLVVQAFQVVLYAVQENIAMSAKLVKIVLEILF